MQSTGSITNTPFFWEMAGLGRLGSQAEQAVQSGSDDLQAMTAALGFQENEKRGNGVNRYRRSHGTRLVCLLSFRPLPASGEGLGAAKSCQTGRMHPAATP